MMIIGEGEHNSYAAEIVRLEMELSDARERVYELKKALDLMSKTNEELSAEVSDLRNRFGVSVSDVEVDYEVVYE